MNLLSGQPATRNHLNLPRSWACASVPSMLLDFRSTVRTCSFRLGLSVCLPVIVLALAATAGERVQFTPKFTPGESLHYRIESRTTTTGKTTTPIVNPEGGSQSKQAIHLLVRLDVLEAQPASTAGAGTVRLRATYEKSSAESDSDAFDSNASSLSDRYGRLEGHSVEFTIGSGGEIANLQGLEDVFPDHSAAEPAFSWLQSISPGNAFPRNGIAIGQKWKSERQLEGAPLSGLVWQTDSTYLRNEACNSSGGATVSTNGQAGSPATCAVILTHFDILRRGSPHSDATPQDYVRNGLRTSGMWTGSGESLDSISFATGLLVSSTETSTQDMDYKITSATTGSTIHRVGKVQSQSEITLVPDQK